MPELPEVECLARGLAPIITHRTITAIRFLRPDLRESIPQDDFQRLILNQDILTVTRRSKYLLWQTTRGFAIFHLGMTGNIFYELSPQPQKPHTHAIFSFAGHGGQSAFYLHYVDPRRFGMIHCCSAESLLAQPAFANLGPEPLEFPRLGEHLQTLAAGRNTPVKIFLMDAANVVGVGNIYASESLFRARIDPRRPAGGLSDVEWGAVAASIRSTLLEAIAAGGTSFRDYRHNDGSKGYFAVALNVYGRNRQPCPKCGKPIHQIVQGGRSTFFCEFCQK